MSRAGGIGVVHSYCFICSAIGCCNLRWPAGLLQNLRMPRGGSRSTGYDDKGSMGRMRGSGVVGPDGFRADADAECGGHGSAFKADSAEIEVKPDSGTAVAFKVTADTTAQRVAPGVTDLKQAQPIQVTEVMLGDRVLATPGPGTSNLRRIVVMAATEIEKRNAADKADWTRRGVAGVVASKSGSEITLKIRTMAGEQQAVVTVSEKTTYKRYAPDR